jgi:hypothetical protein
MRRDVDEYSRLPTHPLDDNYDWIGYKLLGAGWKCARMVPSADSCSSDADSQDMERDSDEDRDYPDRGSHEDAHATATAGN